MGLAEGQVDTGDVGAGIDYVEVSSCLTVTAELEDGTFVGGHLSLQKKGSNHDSTQVLPAMKDLIAGRKVKKVTIAGVLDQWTPAFFDKPFISESGDFNYGPDLSVGDTTSEVVSRLGADGAETKSETKTGDFNIK